MPFILIFQSVQGAPPPYPNQQPGINGVASNKRFKTGEETSAAQQQQQQQQLQTNGRPAQPPFYLSPQQLQMLQHLQQHAPNLNRDQQNVLQQLTSQYRLMQQHQQQMRIQLQQRSQQLQQSVGQQPGQVVGTRLVGGSQQQQFVGQTQQQSGFQQTAPRVPQTGTIAQTGFDVNNGGNFPAATGHTLPNAGMPYKSANVGGGGFQQQTFNSNLGYTQITSTTNQSDMGKFLQISNKMRRVALTNLLYPHYRSRAASTSVAERHCHNVC